MADDLMDFSEFDSVENDENADPETEMAPKLMQTPVVKNSILKQSTKDNLIQLFTPVQKNKKLKVHFTPNILGTSSPDGEAATKDGAKTESPAGLKQSALDDEEREDWIDRTSVLTKQDHENYCQYAKEFLIEMINTLPIKDEQPSTDSGIDESMMDFQEESTVINAEVPQDEASQESEEVDILLQAANLLKSLRQQTGSTSSELEKNTLESNESPPGNSNQSEEAMDCEEPMDVDMSVVHIEHKSHLTEEVTNVDESNTNVFARENAAISENQNISQNGADSVEKVVLTQEDHKEESDNIVFKEHNTVNEDYKSPDINGQSLEPDKAKDDANVLEVFDRSCNNSINEIKSMDDIVSIDRVSSEETVVNLTEPKNIDQESHVESSAKNTKDSAINEEGHSSDEEFLSADEGESEKRKEIESVESPAKTPPKVGYNLNFDDLDPLNPFQSKSCVQNTPDKVLKDHVQFEKNMNNQTKTQVEEPSKGKDIKVADDQIPLEIKKVELTSGVVDMDSEIKVSVNEDVKNTTSEKRTSEEEPESKVENTIENEHKSCKIENVVESENNSCMQEHEQYISEPTALSPPLPKRGTYNLDNLENMDAFQPRAQMVNSPVVLKTDEVLEVQTEKIEKVDETSTNSKKENESALDILDNIGGLQKKIDAQSPPLPKRGAYNLDNLENMDAFQPRAQMVNSPIANQKTSQSTETLEIDPFKPKTQIMNSPVVLKTDAVIEGQTEKIEKVDETSTNSKKENESTLDTLDNIDGLQKKIDDKESEHLGEIDLCKSENKVTNSSSPKQNFYEQLPDNLDDIDPFKPKKQMINSPLASVKSSNDVACSSGQEDLSRCDDIDPFKPRKQIINSPDKDMTQKVDDIDPFIPKQQMMNSPLKTETEKDLPENMDDVDQFKPTSQIKNLPDKSVQENSTTENLDVTDPFKPTKQMMNSPVKDVQDIFAENLDDIDPFKPKTQVVNSPDRVGDENSLPDNLEDIDPFKPRKQMMNSPDLGKGLSCPDLPDNLEDIDPFKPRKQMMNSPDHGKGSSCPDLPDSLEDIDPFKSKSQLPNSPVIKSNVNSDVTDTLEVDHEPKQQDKKSPVHHETKDLNEVTKLHETNNSKERKDIKMDAFDEIDPFKSKSQVPNSPNLRSDVKEIADPFKPRNQMANSPFGKEPALLSSARGAFSPFTTRSKLPSTPEEPFGAEDDVVEVQGVTRRGATDQQNQQGLEFDESEFVAASEVFKDAGVWEMLEQFGSNATNPVQESALSRMSLYVKFDPLVDSTKVPTNPRRISIRPKQLEKVKEYGLEDTLLLLGTPPKKRRQSMNVSQLRHTPVSSRGTPSDCVSRKKELNMGAVDLIMALSPEDSSNADSTRKSSQPQSLLSGIDDDAGAAEGLFEELKYTNSDIKRMRTDLKLEFQGQLIVREKEWCKEKEHYEKLLKESRAKLDHEKKSNLEMVKAFAVFDGTLQQLSEKQETDKKKIATLEKEKQQMFKDIQGVENAFSDLHRRYEKLKTVVEEQRKNEETLKKYVNEVVEKLKKSEEKAQGIKKAAEEKEAKSAKEIAKLKGDIAADQNKHEAAKKVMNMKIENLEKQLEQKKEENKNLTDICDQLIQNSGAR